MTCCGGYVRLRTSTACYTDSVYEARSMYSQWQTDRSTSGVRAR